MDKKGLFIGGSFWDGRATGERLGSPAAEQALGPFLNPVEQALGSPAEVVGLVCGSSYAGLFTQVWGTAACDPANVSMAYDAIGFSIAAYEASPEVNAFSSKFDYARNGMAKLTKEEQLGRAMFNGKGSAPSATPATARSRSSPTTPSTTSACRRTPRTPSTGRTRISSTRGSAASWRHDRTTRPYADANMGKHKVPTLRNVDKRPGPSFVKAFGHNGYFKSLEGIVHFYNTRDVKPACLGDYTEAQALAANCWPAPEVAANVNTAELGNLGLTPEQEAAIVAFLRTLSDGYLP